jgi:hypothetical protein
MNRSKPFSVILLDLLDALVGPKERMLRHVRGILARRGMLAHDLRERANVMRPGAAAHAEIAYPHVEGLFAERRDLIAITGERIESHRGYLELTEPVLGRSRAQRIERLVDGLRDGGLLVEWLDELLQPA